MGIGRLKRSELISILFLISGIPSILVSLSLIITITKAVQIMSEKYESSPIFWVGWTVDVDCPQSFETRVLVISKMANLVANYVSCLSGSLSSKFSNFS
jgi:hypothetical protein